MKIISWNINSLRLRLPLLAKFIHQNQPDIVCLQETKVSDAEFPLQGLQSLGFQFIEFSGEKSYNGVAILAKIPLFHQKKIDVLNYGHKRHIAATIRTSLGDIDLHNFYVPAGGDIPDPKLNPKFNHKLKFVDWMAEFFKNEAQDSGSEGLEEKKMQSKKVIILGDFNIAPLPNDVWSHQSMKNVVSHTEIEVEKLNNLMRSGGFIDSHRFFVEESQKLYSWWSYRAKDALLSNRGRRLDHIWVSQNLKNHLKSAKIYRDFRSEIQPSDHVPVEVEISI